MRRQLQHRSRETKVRKTLVLHIPGDVLAEGLHAARDSAGRDTEGGGDIRHALIVDEPTLQQLAVGRLQGSDDLGHVHLQPDLSVTSRGMMSVGVLVVTLVDAQAAHRHGLALAVDRANRVARLRGAGRALLHRTTDLGAGVGRELSHAGVGHVVGASCVDDTDQRLLLGVLHLDADLVLVSVASGPGRHVELLHGNLRTGVARANANLSVLGLRDASSDGECVDDELELRCEVPSLAPVGLTIGAVAAGTLLAEELTVCRVRRNASDREPQRVSHRSDGVVDPLMVDGNASAERLHSGRADGDTGLSVGLGRSQALLGRREALAHPTDANDLTLKLVGARAELAVDVEPVLDGRRRVRNGVGSGVRHTSPRELVVDPRGLYTHRMLPSTGFHQKDGNLFMTDSYPSAFPDRFDRPDRESFLDFLFAASRSFRNENVS